jgi:hypothetical protein
VVATGAAARAPVGQPVWDCGDAVVPAPAGAVQDGEVAVSAGVGKGCGHEGGAGDADTRMVLSSAADAASLSTLHGSSPSVLELCHCRKSVRLNGKYEADLFVTVVSLLLLDSGSGVTSLSSSSSSSISLTTKMLCRLRCSFYSFFRRSVAC